MLIKCTNCVKKSFCDWCAILVQYVKNYVMHCRSPNVNATGGMSLNVLDSAGDLFMFAVYVMYNVSEHMHNKIDQKKICNSTQTL